MPPDVISATSASDNPWYEQRDEWADAFDATEPLPEPGENELLDILCERKHLTVQDLVRVGARLAPGEQEILVVFWPQGKRMRDLRTGRRWVDSTSDWTVPKVLPGRDRSRCVVVEGETDAARLSGPDGPGLDVLCLGGASNLNPGVEAALNQYDTVFVATDDDTPGNRAATKLERLPVPTVRWLAGDGDWCDVERVPPLPEPPRPLPRVVWGADLFELDLPPVQSFLAEATLPYAGLLLLHGWKGNFKSWLVFDLMVALASGTSWACLDVEHDGLRVGVMQFEVPPFAYEARMKVLHAALPLERQDRFGQIAHLYPGRLADFHIGSEQNREAVLGLCDELELDVVLFDPIRQMTTASMNDEEFQQALVHFFKRVRQQGTAVVCTHHDSKSAARHRGGSPLDMTAGQVIAGAADTIVSVQVPRGDDLDGSRRRNLRFTVRNGPPVGARGFELVGETLEYRPESWTEEDADDTPEI